MRTERSENAALPVFFTWNFTVPDSSFAFSIAPLLVTFAGWTKIGTPKRVRTLTSERFPASDGFSSGGSSSTNTRYVLSTAPAGFETPIRIFRSFPGSSVRSAGKNTTSSVGASSISPRGLWFHANAVT